jgi:DNA polymerase I-like protein with 3'-5' exonuclease and polymerase domains
MAYGAGAKKISATTGISLEAVEAMIEAEDALYPGVPQFHKEVERSVNRTARPFFDPVLGIACKRGYWQSPTGTLYGFRSYPAPAYLKKQGIMDSFMPTEIKNYPTQGESGFFVQAVLGKLIRHFIQNNFYNGMAYLVNTVHDCIWVDCHKSVLHEVVADIKRIMQSIPEIFNTTFGMQIDVPFPVEVETGPDMYNLTHYDKAA